MNGDQLTTTLEDGGIWELLHHNKGERDSRLVQ